jgi:protein-tyrosine phosphatase
LRAESFKLGSSVKFRWFKRKKEVASRDYEYRVLFVCMGNICRSPTAEGVFRKLVDDAGLAGSIYIDSAGTHAYHVGEQPDRRAREAASRRGITMEGQRARRVADEDFEVFDLFVAMDRLNLETLRDRADDDAHGRLRLMLEFARTADIEDVPDPYYGGAAGFERVLDLVEEAAEGLLEHLREEVRRRNSGA